MATLQIKDGAGATVYLKVTGAGTSGDPYVPSHVVDSSYPKHGTKTFTTNAPTTTAASALAANTSRIRAVIVNNGTQTVYLGKDNTVTSSNGVPLLAGQAYEDTSSTDAWFAITASGTGDLRISEVA